jgi:predicted Fe-Mo cluster-binding NifX family protein
MNVAIPIWNHRVSPVFDAARRLLIVPIENGEEQPERNECILNESDFFNRVKQLQLLEIDLLICGAISKPLHDSIQNNGIKVISHVCGFVEEILEAYCTDQIQQERFLMPGCCGQRRNRLQRRRSNCGKNGRKKGAST